MKRRSFLLGLACLPLFRRFSFGKRRADNGLWHSDLPVIRRDDKRIVNADFIFEGLPWQVCDQSWSGCVQHQRVAIAWLPEELAGSYIDFSNPKKIRTRKYWGKVRVVDWKLIAPDGGERRTTWANIHAESFTKD